MSVRRRTPSPTPLLAAVLLCGAAVALLAGCKPKQTAYKTGETISAYAKDMTDAAGKLTNKAGETLGLVEKKYDYVRLAWQAEEPPATLVHTYSYEDEREIGRALAAECFARHGRFAHGDLDAYLNRIAAALAAHSSRPARPAFAGVLRTESPEAHGLPGGYLLVSLGALRACESESELAGVLAQALAQVETNAVLAEIERAQTAHEAARKKPLTQAGEEVFTKVVQDTAAELMARGLPGDRVRAADRRATDLMVRVGYEPGGLKAFLARIEVLQHSATGGAPLKDYGKSKARAEAIDARLAQLHAPSQGRSIAVRFRRECTSTLPARKLE